MKKYIGFDIDDKRTTICVFEKAVNGSRFKTIETNLEAMRGFLVREREIGDELHLTFEVSGQAGYLYDGVVEYADTLTVGNPSKMTWIYRTSKKNDRTDAKKQAILLSVNQVPAVHMPGVEVREWRGLIGHRRKLVEGMTQCKHRIRGHVKSRGLKKVHRSHWWSKRNRVWMREMSEQEDTPWHLALDDLLAELDLHERQIVRATKRLDAMGKKDSRVQLLRAIPGVGPRTAEAVVAYTDDVERFHGRKQFAGYFGVTPKLDESGATRRLGHISKQGRSVVRWTLAGGCWRAIRQSASLNTFYERVQHGQPGRKKIALVAVVRKVLTIMYAMLKSGEVFKEGLVVRQLGNVA